MPIKRSDGVERYYMRGNNHHIEVLENIKTGLWEFDPVDMFTAAARIKPPKKRKRQTMVNRKDRHGKRFVMSLAEGETLFMKNPPPPKGSTKAEEYDYFVVAKIDDHVHVIHHTDARPAKARKNPKTGLTEEERELIRLSARQLQQLCLPSGEPPRKVRVKLPAYKDEPASVQVLQND